MTSQTLIPRIQFTANGVQTAFPFPFPVTEGGDMEVWVGQSLQPRSAYSLSGIGVAVGGSVIFVVPPPASSLVTLRRRMVLNRTPEFPDTEIQAKPLNEEFAYHTAALQQISDDAALAVKRSFRSLSSADLTLPEPESGKAIRWNDAGDGLVNSTLSPDTILPLATAQAEAAAASAAAALSSQSAASAGATAAAASASAAAAHGDSAASARTAAEAARDLAQGFAAAANVARIKWMGAWSSAVAYAVSDAVSYGGSSWICVAAHTNHVPADNAWWNRLAAKGTDGTGIGDLLAANNLSDLADPASARGNLGLAAVAASGAYGDLTGTPSLGTAAAQDVGISSGQIPRLDATGLPALNASQLTAINASALASGTVGTARLGAGTASSSTYLRGDQTWAAISGGGYEYVSSAAPSGTAVAFTGLASGYDYILTFENLVSTGSGSGAAILAQVGVGGSYRTSGYYSSLGGAINGGQGWGGITSGIAVCDPREDGLSRGSNGVFELINPGNPGTKSTGYSHGSYVFNGGGQVGGGYYGTAEANDCVRLVNASGNTLSGTMIMLFRRKRS